VANRSEAASRLRKSLTWARKQKGWSQRTLADRAGVSVDTVQKLESGRSSATMAVAERIAKALQVPLSMLLGEREDDGALPGWMALGPPERALVVALVGYFVARSGREQQGAS